MTTDNTKNKRPDFHAYTVKQTGKDTSIWTQIGAGWNHNDHDGINIILDCIPLDGRITLRIAKQDDQNKPEEN